MSKNIVICFDGTWNTADAQYPTNVVKTAQLIAPEDGEGDEQAVFYDSGVGSSRTIVANTINRMLGGAFGAGLLDNIERAYRNLIFNYAPGDRIFIFGFSRGAFGARSFCGLLRTCGILDKDHIRCVPDALELYRQRDAEKGPDAEACVKFRQERSVACYHSQPSDLKKHALNVEYLGVWDTVGALGIPNGFLFIGGLERLAKRFNRRYEFHDPNLSSMVRSARHAVAIDERRLTFKPTLWENIVELNQKAGWTPPAPPPYEQVWFPGDHASVGGGGLYNGLWEASLTWVVAGARNNGLAIREDKFAEYISHIKHTTRVDTIADGSFQLSALSPYRWRDGPDGTFEADVSEIGVKRMKAAVDELEDRKRYRPTPLRKFVDAFGSKFDLTWD
jgi:uncharacterized protein (DUF2235 family)